MVLSSDSTKNGPSENGKFVRTEKYGYYMRSAHMDAALYMYNFPELPYRDASYCMRRRFYDSQWFLQLCQQTGPHGIKSSKPTMPPSHQRTRPGPNVRNSMCQFSSAVRMASCNTRTPVPATHRAENSLLRAQCNCTVGTEEVTPRRQQGSEDWAQSVAPSVQPASTSASNAAPLNDKSDPIVISRLPQHQLDAFLYGSDTDGDSSVSAPGVATPGTLPVQSHVPLLHATESAQTRRVREFREDIERHMGVSSGSGDGSTDSD